MPRVCDAEAFAPELGFVAKGAAIADVELVVLCVRGVEPAIGGKLAKRFLFEIILPVGVAVRLERDVTRLTRAIRTRAVVKDVPAPASRASGAYLLSKLWYVFSSQ